ncbi:hypothetical protein Sjap_007747 [Stephania japonica]|uniref:Uncharacterized protein n=1 Tax=Stephania japonica TaxID=461633 RepID=A0AAP0PA80_9MAGN
MVRRCMVDVLMKQNIVPGIKVDKFLAVKKIDSAAVPLQQVTCLYEEILGRRCHNFPYQSSELVRSH